MKKIKFLAIIGAVIVCLGMLTGCGEKSEEEQLQDAIEDAIDDLLD